ncbi:MAG: PAS domain S-box protein [Anaerolineae bacterium]
MAQRTNVANHVLQKLAATIQTELETLVTQYDARLADRPGYRQLPAHMRRDLERQLLNRIADALTAGDSHDLVEHVRERANQWVAGGLDIAWFQDALIVSEEILVPLIDSVSASTFLWQALNRSQGVVWQIVAERASQVEQTIRRNQQLFQAVMDNIPQLIFWKDRNSIYLGCNRNFAQAAGIGDPAKIVGKSDYDLAWKREESDAFRRDDVAVMASGRPKYHIIEPQLQADGRQTWADTNKIPLFNAEGEVIGVLGTYEDITERKHAEENVRANEERLRAIYEGTNDAVMLLNERGFFDCNPRTLSVFGFSTKEEFAAVHPADVSPAHQPDGQDSWEAAQAHIRTAYQQGYDRFEWVHRRTNGQDFPAEVLLSAFDLRGQRVLQATVRDITDRKNAEAVVRESQQRFQGLVETLSDWVWEVDPTGVYTYVSPKIKDLLGYGPEEVLGKTPFDFMPADEAKRVAGVFGPLLAAKQPLVNLENTNRHKDGHLVVFETNGVPFFDVAGKFLGYRGTDRDVTERKQAAQELAREHNLLRTLIDTLPDQVFFKDAEGRIMLYNEADARAMRIASTDEAVGKTVYDLYPRELADLYHADDMAVINSDQPLLNREEPGVDLEGQPRWVLTTKVPLKDANGIPLGLVGVARDITARRKVELKLQESEERFRRFSEATFEGLVFHEKGKILDANPAIVAMFGYESAAEMIGRSILEVIVPDCRPLVIQKMQLNDVHPYEIDCLRKDGTIFPVETATRTYEYGGRTVRASSLRDITQRKQLEQSIRESFDRRGREVEVSRQVAQEIATTTNVDDIFPLVVKLIKERFDYYHAQIFRYDPNQGSVVLVAGYGEAGQQMLAAGHKLAMGRGVVGTAAQTGKSILATDSSHDADWRPNPNLPATKGELAVPIKFQDEILGILDVQSDRVNALDQDDVLLLEGLAGQIAVAIANTRTLEEANTFRALVEAAGQGIAFADTTGRPVYLNAAGLRMYGLNTSEDLVGRSITDFYPAAERARVQESIGLALQTGQWTGELNIAPANGAAPISTINNVFPVRDRTGKLRYIADIITDITERKFAEQRLAEAMRLAKIGYWSYDVPTDTFKFNDQFYALMHTTAERENGYTMTSAQYTQRFVHPEDAPLVGTEIGKALTTTDPNYRGEVSHRVYFGDGELGYVTVRFTVEKDAQGQTIRTSGANQDITEIKRAEEELRASEGQLSQALQIAKLAYWEYDVEKDLFLFNDQFFALFHTTAAEHGGYQLPSAYYAEHFVYPDDLPIVGSEIEKALTSTDRHYNRSIEHRIQYADGGVGYISVNINIDRDEQGKILRYYGANQDITERKGAEEALHASEEKYRDLINGMNDSICVIDFDTKILDVNNAATRVLGYSRDELLSMKIPDIDANLAPGQIQDLASSMPRDKVQVFETFHKTKTGERLPVEVSSSLVSYGGQTVILSIARDITERQLAEEARKEVEERFRIIAQTTPVPIIISAQADGMVLYGNEQAGTVFGVPLEQLVGRPMPDFYFDPADRSILVEQVRSAGGVKDYELHVKRADGTPFWALLSMQPLLFAKQPALFTVFYDITERKLAEEAIRRSEAQLSEALRTTRLAYWELDFPRQKFIFNDQLYALLHTTAEAEGGYEMAIDAYVGRFIYPEDIPYVGGAIAQGVQNPDPTSTVQLEARVICADGEIRWLATQVRIKVDATGQAISATGTNQDITERKQAELALRSSEAQLTEALHIAQLANWTYDVPTDTFTFNDQFYRLMRTTAERENGYTMTSAQYAQRFVHPEDAPLVGVEIGKALTTTDPNYRGEVSHRVYFGDGELGWVTVRFTIEKDAQGQTIRTSGANQDITERKQAEAEIERSEQLMRTVINSTPDWIFIKDQEHRYQLVNQGYADSLHIPIDSFIGRDDLELGFPEELVKGNPEKGLAGFWADDRAVMDSGKPKVIPNDIVAIDGAERIFHTIKTPLRDATGNVWGVLAFARDVTEREQLLQDVQRRATQVEAVAEVGAAAAEVLESQALLERIVRLTRHRFNLYHCHIFLLDEASRTLKVRACGWRDSEDENRPPDDHVIRLDAVKSLVARAARTRQPVIVNDVQADPGWLPNPLLPDIHSEMALPMIVGDTVLGVFNVHSDEREHFTKDDARTMLTLATQTAIALQNARLFEQAQRAAEEMDLLNRRLTGEAWEAYLQRKTREHVLVAKSHDTAAPDPLPVLNESLAAGEVVVDQTDDRPTQTITAPIVLRGQTVGALRVQATPSDWNEDLQTVLTGIASHIAQAAENTRLLEESEIRFARERALAEATGKIRRSSEVERIVETAAAELARYLQTRSVSVRVGETDLAQPD